MKWKSIMILILSILTILMTGCNGGCIKIGGTYKDYSGDIEYCFDSDKSKDLGVPVLDEVKENGETDELFGFDLGQINNIVDKIKGQEVSSSGTNKTNEKQPAEHPVKELLKILRE